MLGLLSLSLNLKNLLQQSASMENIKSALGKPEIASNPSTHPITPSFTHHTNNGDIDENKDSSSNRSNAVLDKQFMVRDIADLDQSMIEQLKALHVSFTYIPYFFSV